MNRNDIYKSTLINVALLIIQTNVLFIIGDYKTVALNLTNPLQYLSKGLFIAFLFNKDIFSEKYKKPTLFFALIIFIMILSDIYNGQKHFLSYLNYILYYLVFFNFLEINKQPDINRKLLGIFATSFYVTMSLILLFKFYLNPSFSFRELRLSAIFATAAEDAGYYLMFALLTIFYIKWKHIKIGIFTITIFLLIFALGTKTSLFALICIIFIFVMFQFKKRKLTSTILIMILLFSFDIFLEHILTDVIYFMPSSKILSSENTFAGRAEQIWVPAVNYTLNESPILGFGSNGWVKVVQNSIYQGGYFENGVYKRSAHNLAVVLFAKYGLIYLLLITCIFIHTSLLLLRNYQSSKDDFYFSVLLAWLSFIFTSMTANIDNLTGFMFMSIFIGIAYSPFYFRSKENS